MRTCVYGVVRFGKVELNGFRFGFSGGSELHALQLYMDPIGGRRPRPTHLHTLLYIYNTHQLSSFLASAHGPGMGKRSWVGTPHSPPESSSW